MRCKCLLIVLLIVLHSKATSIALTFSGGYKSHLSAAALLKQRNLNATFYLNSNLLTFQNDWLNVFDVDYLTSLEFEIGGYTLDRVDLSNEDSATIVEQICANRGTLFANQWVPKSFHYPFGKFNDNTDRILKECGYNSALVILRNRTSIPFILDQYHIPYHAVTQLDSLQDLINQIQSSEGISVLNFQNIDSVPDSTFVEFLNWIQDTINNSPVGTLIVKSIDELVGGIVQGVPEEYANINPTNTPDPDAQIKLLIGTSCLGALFLLVMWVIITTQIKRKKKIKFCC